jgi:hypothetical protein
MKYFLWLLFTLSSTYSFAQKNISEHDAVKKVATTFIHHVLKEEYDKAKKLSTSGTQSMLDQMKMYSAMIPDSMVSEINKQRKKMREATITFNKFTFGENNKNSCTAYFVSSERPKSEEAIFLIKKDQAWLVALEGLMPNQSKTQEVTPPPPPPREPIAPKNSEREH